MEESKIIKGVKLNAELFRGYNVYHDTKFIRNIRFDTDESTVEERKDAVKGLSDYFGTKFNVDDSECEWTSPEYNEKTAFIVKEDARGFYLYQTRLEEGELTPEMINENSEFDSVMGELKNIIEAVMCAKMGITSEDLHEKVMPYIEKKAGVTEDMPIPLKVMKVKLFLTSRMAMGLPIEDLAKEALGKKNRFFEEE